MGITGTQSLSSGEEVRLFLVERGLVHPPDEVRVELLSGGVSADTFLVRRPRSPDWVVKQALPRLRVDTLWTSDPRRIHREATALRWLNGVLGPDSTVQLVDEDLDRHALVMEAVPFPHSTWKERLLAGDVRDEHVNHAATILARMHESGRRERDALKADLPDDGTFEDLRLEPYYRYTSRRVPECGRFLLELADATASRRDGFVHGDFSPKNVLIQPRQRRGDRVVLIDHEVAHVGDQAFDVGFLLAHFLGKANLHPDRVPLYRNAALHFWQVYADMSADVRAAGFEQRAVRHLLACSLARAAGRSPLEYLDDEARRRQRLISTTLIERAPVSLVDTVRAFMEELRS